MEIVAPATRIFRLFILRFWWIHGDHSPRNPDIYNIYIAVLVDLWSPGCDHWHLYYIWVDWNPRNPLFILFILRFPWFTRTGVPRNTNIYIIYITVLVDSWESSHQEPKYLYYLYHGFNGFMEIIAPGTRIFIIFILRFWWIYGAPAATKMSTIYIIYKWN